MPRARRAGALATQIWQALRAQQAQLRRGGGEGGAWAVAAAAAAAVTAAAAAAAAWRRWHQSGGGGIGGGNGRCVGHGSWRSAPAISTTRSIQHSHAFESARWTIRRAKRPILLLPVLSRESTHAFNPRTSPLAMIRFVRLRSRSFSSTKPRHRLKALGGPSVTMRDAIALASRSSSSTCGKGGASW